jgi:hypothetical protein
LLFPSFDLRILVELHIYHQILQSSPEVCSIGESSSFFLGPPIFQNWETNKWVKGFCVREVISVAEDFVELLGYIVIKVVHESSDEFLLDHVMANLI